TIWIRPSSALVSLSMGLLLILFSRGNENLEGAALVLVVHVDLDAWAPSQGLGPRVRAPLLVDHLEPRDGLGRADVAAEGHALLTDECRRPRDQLADLVLALAAEGAVERIGHRRLRN